MSHSMVGNFYSGIIDDVINASRVDFEEQGIDEAVLEQLRTIWQTKLSHLKIAKFPWDPASAASSSGSSSGESSSDDGALASLARIPAPGPSSQLAPSAYSQAHLTPTMAATPTPTLTPTATPAPTLPHQGLSLPVLPERKEVYIKQEPDADADAKQESDSDVDIKQEPAYRQGEALHRATRNLETAFGPRASNSIEAIHRGQSSAKAPGNQQAYSQPHLPQMFPPPPGSLSGSQTDGTADHDYEGVPKGRVGADRWLRDLILSRGKDMEGGGLMLPLREVIKSRISRVETGGARGPGQVDGGTDDDAINSELDDSDDGDDGMGEDDPDNPVLGNQMLCMYDKVQRVKNKWKCTLKDGVMTVNGKEYVFHKATGEYEW